MKRITVVISGVLVTGMLVSNLVVLQKVSKIEQEVEQVKKDVKEVQKVVLYKTKERLQVSQKEIDCLAKNIFFEAGVEDRAGKLAVAQITLNRLKSGRWGKDICSVVYAKAQFSWTLDKKKKHSQPKGELWEASKKVAYEFVNVGKRVKGLENSEFYHTDYIRQPNWAKGMQVVHKVGQHIFYQRT